MNTNYKPVQIGEIIKDKWEVVDIFHGFTPISGRKKLYIQVKCLDCEYIDSGIRYNIFNRKTCKHCKELEVQSMVGQRYERLIVQRILETRATNGGHILAECLCNCGNITTVPISRLKSGHTRSCGCLEAEGNNYTHRMSNTRLYKIWKGIKTRCYNSNSKTYQYYGARGIKMCDEWANDFIPFYEWSMANGYTDELSIDRIDPDWHYCPENCRWITMQEQQRNKNNTVYINYNNTEYTMGQLADYYGCRYYDIHYRYYSGDLNNYLNQIYHNNMQNIINKLHFSKINQDYYNMKCKC